MLTGSCLCGQVRYAVEAEIDVIVHCHCHTCRKTHGAAFSSVASVPRETFHWTAGETLLGAFESSPGKLRRFCTACGSQLVAERRTAPTFCCVWAASTPRSRRLPANGTSGARTRRPGTTRPRRCRNWRKGSSNESSTIGTNGELVMGCDVLIVGAGPTGLVLALWLTKQGVRVRIIDKTAEAGTTSRALAVQARTLELWLVSSTSRTRSCGAATRTLRSICG